ncbi:MAG: DUF2828 family protein, partial [Nanoarchaeota archaeon]
NIILKGSLKIDSRDNEENLMKYVQKNLINIPFYARFDDVFCLLDFTFSPNIINLRKDVIALINNQLIDDLDNAQRGNSISLISKWLSSNNTSSKESRRKANFIAEHLGISSKQYRKMLSYLRSKLKVVERDMCAQNWQGIDYQKVPSKASLLYRGAFKKHDALGYGSYIESVSKGEAKINASVLYPHDILDKMFTYSGFHEANEQKTLDVLWKNLPNFFDSTEKNRLVVADVSGSMFTVTGKVKPICVAVALAIYFAERNKGKFRNNFITFSEKPNLISFNDNQSLLEKTQIVAKQEWGTNTNLQAVFDLILDGAKEANLKEEEMPEQIFIISDGQADYCGETTNFELIKAKYGSSGYKLPKVIFWNVNGNYKDNPVQENENGVALVSGYSPSVLKYVMTSEIVSPTEVMMEVLNSPRYRMVQI